VNKDMSCCWVMLFSNVRIKVHQGTPYDVITIFGQTLAVLSLSVGFEACSLVVH